MAKMKLGKYTCHKSAGGYQSLSVQLNVNVEGEFYGDVPDEYLKFVEQATSKREGVYMRSKPVPGTRLIGGKKQYITQLFAANLKDLEAVFQSLVNTAADSGTKEELVILYKIENNVSYWKNDDGSIEPTAKRRPLAQDDGNWKGVKYSQDLKSYAVNVYARVMVKVTQDNSDYIKYINPAHSSIEGNNDQTHPFLYLLNEFKLAFATEDRWLDGLVDISELKQMPYTELRAKFFYELLLGMCKLADRFEVLTDDTNLRQIVDSGKMIDFKE